MVALAETGSLPSNHQASLWDPLLSDSIRIYPVKQSQVFGPENRTGVGFTLIACHRDLVVSCIQGKFCTASFGP